MSKLWCFVVFLLISLVHCQQLQWYLISDGSSYDTPAPRRNAALGFDMSFLILFGGRDSSGMPLQDSYAFNTLIGQWELLNFPNSPPARYGMGSANAIGNGLYVFGGFGSQGGSSNYNPYMAYGSSGLPSYKQSPAVSSKQQQTGPTAKQNMNGMNPSAHNYYYGDDDRADDNFYPLQDGWVLNYATKTWQNVQSFQYARGLGSATASPFSIGGVPRIIYSMGKSRDGMYSTVESVDQMVFGYKQLGYGQAATIMQDLSSYSPAYPHARYGHSTALLTDNHLLLYGGCLSGYSKGGPCPSTDTWLFYLDRGHWERLWECPTTKTGAAMVTLPSSDMCAAMTQGIYGASGSFGMGATQPVAILWGGREKNPSSIRTYPSPDDEVAVFSLSQKQWTLRRAAPSPTGGQYPMQREDAAYVAGCFQGMPGMFIFGGRSVIDGRLLSDLWFLSATPSSALNAPRGRSCIYPFSYYHLHGLFQFFAYGVFFPIGYILGASKLNNNPKLFLHIGLQLLGTAIAICGFSFGVHAVRGPSRFHFRSPHGVIGIITFILTIIQVLLGIANFVIVSSKRRKESFSESNKGQPNKRNTSFLAYIHHSLGALIVALGFVNISLGVFFAVLPLAVWIIWYIYLGFLVLIIIGVELVSCLRPRSSGGSKKPRKPDDGKIKISEYNHQTNRPKPGPLPPLERLSDEDANDRRPYRGEIEQPLLPNTRNPRPGEVSGSGSLPQYHRPSEREYPVPQARARPNDSTGFDFYVGRPSGQQTQQNQRNLTRVRLE